MLLLLMSWPGYPEGYPDLRPFFLLLDFGHVRAAPFGGLLETNAEFVLL
jgi:hypothetical protein